MVPATPTALLLPISPSHFLDFDTSHDSQCPQHQPQSLFLAFKALPSHCLHISPHTSPDSTHPLLFPFLLNKSWAQPQLGTHHTFISFPGLLPCMSLCLVCSPSFSSQRKTPIHPSMPSSEGVSSGLDTEHLQWDGDPAVKQNCKHTLPFLSGLVTDSGVGVWVLWQSAYTDKHGEVVPSRRERRHKTGSGK